MYRMYTNPKFNVNVSLVAPSFGNLRVYENVVTPRKLAHIRRYFDCIDGQGTRRKQVTRFDIDRESLEIKESKSKLRSVIFRPDSPKVHPTLISFPALEYGHSYEYDDVIRHTINYFVDECRLVRGTHEDEVIFQAERVSTIIPRETESWHQADVKHVGMVVLARENVKGGVDQFRSFTGDLKLLELSQQFEPGSMIIFDDANVFHRVTDVESLGGNHGHRDIFLMTMGSLSSRS